ncbi:hypothetical protein J437_LFUL019201 [Ladona fulva]|uniref:Uncharacterized protein n=1 Tax=Ladona fulva TaxID=123851 RepID=A0A8K0KRI9_LADFU|nr:hypothetical protein J437_LFUL019201 [Ladona fulva]
MVPFKGKLAAKQYVRGKHTPWGIKIFLLCGKGGTAYDFMMYHGKSTIAVCIIAGKCFKTFGFTAAVVLKLSERMSKREIYAGETVRVNRFYSPPLISDNEIMKNERGLSSSVTSKAGDVILTKCLDNRTVVIGYYFVSIGEEDIVDQWGDKKKNT